MSDSLLDTIEPNSDQLNADDLLAGPITVTVTDVTRGKPDQPIDVHLNGFRPWRPCKTMRRVLIAAYGEFGKDWIGQSITLYRDPDVVYGGQKEGGIRISHLSGLSKPLELALTIRRGKRKLFHVEPLKLAKPETFEKLKLAAQNCKSPEQYHDLQARVKNAWASLNKQQTSELIGLGKTLAEKYGHDTRHGDTDQTNDAGEPEQATRP